MASQPKRRRGRVTWGPITTRMAVTIATLQYGEPRRRIFQSDLGEDVRPGVVDDERENHDQHRRGRACDRQIT